MKAEVSEGKIAMTGETAVFAWELRLLALLLIVFAIVLATVAWHTGVTADEPAHLLSAHLYWKGQDTLLPGDMPPAIKIVGGWVSHFFPLPVPYDHEAWKLGNEWDAAQVMMQRMQAPLLQRVFFFSRLTMIVFPLLTCVTLWMWARRMFSPRTALLLVGLFCLSPTVLGHGALFKNDLAASFGYLLFCYRAWAYWKVPSARNAAWMGAGLLAALLAKMSLFVLIPIAPLILIARHFTAHSLRPLAIHLAMLILIPYVGVLAAWQFRVDVMVDEDIRAWQEKPQIPRWITSAAEVLRYIPTPTRLRKGAISLVEANDEGMRVYMLGEIYPGGHPLYFLIALATKGTLPFLFLLITALALLALDLARRRLTSQDLLWIVPPLFYIGVASLASLQLGMRLILPGLVCLLLWCGRPVELLLKRRATVAILAVLFTWLGVRSGIQYPNYISYFNSLVGGSDEGIHYLSDSNLDWGQDLPALAEYLQDNSIPSIRLAYFGTDNPYAYIPKDRIVPITPPWSSRFVRGSRLEPQPGHYAISATLLTGQHFDPQFRDYFRVFRDAEPIGKAGYSIFIYEVR